MTLITWRRGSKPSGIAIRGTCGSGDTYFEGAIAPFGEFWESPSPVHAPQDAFSSHLALPPVPEVDKEAKMAPRGNPEVPTNVRKWERGRLLAGVSAEGLLRTGGPGCRRGGVSLEATLRWHLGGTSLSPTLSPWATPGFRPDSADNGAVGRGFSGERTASACSDPSADALPTRLARSPGRRVGITSAFPSPSDRTGPGNPPAAHTSAART
jgi:hypothetical protein